MKTTRALLAAGVAAACLFGAGIAGAADAKDTDTKAAEEPVTTKKSDAVTKRAEEAGADRALPEGSWMGTEPQDDTLRGTQTREGVHIGAAEDPVTTKKSDAVTERAGKLGAERGLPKEAWMGTEPQRDYPDADEKEKEEKKNGKGKKNGNGNSSRDK